MIKMDEDVKKIIELILKQQFVFEQWVEDQFGQIQDFFSELKMDLFVTSALPAPTIDRYNDLQCNLADLHHNSMFLTKRIEIRRLCDELKKRLEEENKE